MKLNLDKCVTLQCYRTLSPVLSNYVIEGHTLDNVNQHHYLGMILDKTVSFTAHINNTVSKASKILLLRETCPVAYNQPKQLHTSVLYCPPWNMPVQCGTSIYQLVYINNVEKIQRRATRWVLNDYNRYSSVTSMLQLVLQALDQ